MLKLVRKFKKKMYEIRHKKLPLKTNGTNKSHNKNYDYYYKVSLMKLFLCFLFNLNNKLHILKVLGFYFK